MIFKLIYLVFSGFVYSISFIGLLPCWLIGSLFDSQGNYTKFKEHFSELHSIAKELSGR